MRIPLFLSPNFDTLLSLFRLASENVQMSQSECHKSQKKMTKKLRRTRNIDFNSKPRIKCGQTNNILAEQKKNMPRYVRTTV